MKTKVRSASSLVAHVGYWLRFVSNHVSHAFRLKVESHGVTVAEWVILRALYDVQEAKPSEVAEKLGMTRGAISKLMDRVVEKGLVSCRVEKKDRRFQSVALTEAGRKLVPALAELADENDEEFFGHMSGAEREKLVAILKDIVERRGLKTVPVS